MRRTVIELTLLLALVTPGTSCPAENSEHSSTPPNAQPVFREVRYRLSGAIRPLLLWLGDGDVGAARLVRREDGNSLRGYEFLVGSDPSRVPRGINRWGWEWEEQRGDGATQMGLMCKIDEKTLEEAKSKAGVHGEYAFKAIRTEITGGRARAENTLWLVPDDYTYYDLDELLLLVRGTPQSPPVVHEAEIPQGTHPGLLFAIADLVDRSVEAATREPRELLENVTAQYTFNAMVCDLTLRKTKWEDSKEYGGHRYERLVRLDFRSHDPRLPADDHFTLACGTEGEWKGVPVYMKFQPKWWFKTEGVIDDSQVFEKRHEQTRRLESEERTPETESKVPEGVR